MLNLIPLTGARLIMTNRYVQPRLIRPPLQFEFPQPKAITITTPAISTNQHPLRLGIKRVAHLSPPTANTLHGKTRRVMRTAHGHAPFIVLLVVDTTRDRLGYFRVGEIMHVHLNRMPFWLPFLPGIPVVSHLFLLLGVDRDDRPASTQERLALALDVPKLSIPIGMLFSFFGLGIALQTVVQVMQQLGNRHMAHGMPLGRQQESQLAGTLTSPPERGHGITPSVRVDQGFQGLNQLGIMLSQRLASGTGMPYSLHGERGLRQAL